MKKQQHTAMKSGYILVLALLILSITVIIVTQLSQRVFVHRYFDRAMIERQKAQQLALGGIQLAMSSLVIENPESEKKEAKPDELLVLIKNIVPILNQVQSYQLKKEYDGVDGMLRILITAEDGKLDINKIWDFSQQKFAGDESYKGALRAFFAGLKKVANAKDLLAPFEKFLKERQYRLQDVTELLEIKEFNDVFADAVFYDSAGSDAEKKQGQKIYLTDIFTVNSDQKTLDPWLLSDSNALIFGLENSEARSSQARKKEIEELIKGLKSVRGEVKNIWEQYLAKIYGREYVALPKDLVPLLNFSSTVQNFMLFSAATVGLVTQRVVALVERAENNEFFVKKLYWL